MPIEISKLIDNISKSVALEVDKNGNNNGIVDGSEESIFTEELAKRRNEVISMAIPYMENQKCIEIASRIDGQGNKNNLIDGQERGFYFDNIDLYEKAAFSKTNTSVTVKSQTTPSQESSSKSDVFSEMDAEYQRKLDLKNKTEMRNKIYNQIAENNKKIKLYERRLTQAEITKEQYRMDVKGGSNNEQHMKKTINISTAATILVGAIEVVACTTLGAATGGAALIAGGAIAYAAYEEKNPVPKNQDRIRDKYKKAYLKLLQENEKLQAQLEELNK